MIEIIERRFGLYSKLFYRCYVFRKGDKNEVAYIYMDTYGTYKPTNISTICLAHTRPWYPENFRKIRDIVGETQYNMIQAKVLFILDLLENDTSINATQATLLLDLIEAFIQMDQDLKDGVPMHRIERS
jgi:hypothetical protein